MHSKDCNPSDVTAEEPSCILNIELKIVLFILFAITRLCFLLVPSVSKNRMGVGAFFQVLLLWNQHQFGFRRQTLLLLLRLSLSLSFSVKHLVKAGTGDPEASLGYATIGLGS